MGFGNIVITGAKGMLGQALTAHLRAKGFQVFPLTRDYMSLLETSEGMREKLTPMNPDMIIHTAAYTAVDEAEREPDLAMAVNKDGTRNLVLATRELNAIMVYISTDYVFDGLKGEPYLPEDRPNPLSIYGLSKYYGELMVSELMEEYYIIRTSWVYGIHKRNFVQWVLDQSRLGNEIRAATDWIGSPTWTGNLCMAIETLMTSGRYGIHHACDEGVLSRYEQAKAICLAAGLSDVHVHGIPGEELRLPANRPHYSAMTCPGLSVPSWQTGLQGYLTQYHHQSSLSP